MPKSRIRISLLVAAIVGELLLLAWLFRPKWLPVPVVPAANPARVALAPAVPVPGVVAAASKPVATKPAGVPFTADICGVGKVPLVAKPIDAGAGMEYAPIRFGADGRPIQERQMVPNPDAVSAQDQAIDEWVNQRAKQTYADTRAALRTSGDARLRAFSLRLDLHELGNGTLGGAGISELAWLAMGTNDPVVYGIAYASCRSLIFPYAGKFRNAGCESLNVQRWIELDPQNSVPWLVAASEAEVAGDSQAAADAMHRAASARNYDNYSKVLMNALDKEVWGNADSLEHAAVQADLIPFAGETREFSLDPVLRFCARGHMESEVRRAECDRISTFLIASGTTGNELNVGLHVARITDPDQPALESVRQLRDLMIFRGLPPGAHWSCRYRDQKQDLIQAYLAGGALAARLALREQFETAPPAFSQEQADELDAQLERTANMPLLPPADPAGP